MFSFLSHPPHTQWSYKDVCVLLPKDFTMSHFLSHFFVTFCQWNQSFWIVCIEILFLSKQNCFGQNCFGRFLDCFRRYLDCFRRFFDYFDDFFNCFRRFFDFFRQFFDRFRRFRKPKLVVAASVSSDGQKTDQKISDFISARKQMVLERCSPIPFHLCNKRKAVEKHSQPEQGCQIFLSSWHQNRKKLPNERKMS
jgi:hypothetical protein